MAASHYAILQILFAGLLLEAATQSASRARLAVIAQKSRIRGRNCNNDR
jgi:hypothetical protein